MKELLGAISYLSYLRMDAILPGQRATPFEGKWPPLYSPAERYQAMNPKKSQYQATTFEGQEIGSRRDR